MLPAVYNPIDLGLAGLLVLPPPTYQRDIHSTFKEHLRHHHYHVSIIYKMPLAHCPVKSRNKKKQTKTKVPRWIQYFKYQQRKLHEILSFLYQIQPGPEFRTLKDEQLKNFRIQLFDLDLKTGETPPSVTQYFLPSDAPGISSGGSGTDPIDDGFTRYNKTNIKRVYGDAKWPEHLADGFLDHAHKLKHNVFDRPWKQVM